MTRDQILDCLDREQIRATYGAVGDVIGIPAQSVGRALGRRTQRASWVVNARTGEPTGYNDQQKHPDLRRTSCIITTGDELRDFCAKCHGRSATAQADRQRSRSPTGIASPVFFISADWSKDARNRSVHVADLSARRIRHPQDSEWTLKTLLKLAAELAQRGPVLVGVDAALGIPADYWSAVQAQYGKSGDRPLNFIDWLCRIDPHSEFFVEVHEPRQWRADRPFFSVPGRKGGLNDFKSRFSDGFLRPIDKSTGAKPLFAVSGIPGTVGAGTRALWKDLIPLLRAEREFAVWPFEGELGELLSRRRIVLAETYPGLAYAAALADKLPARQLKVAKTNEDARRCGCDAIQAASWVKHYSVDLGDLDPVRVDEDAFDSHLTAAAVLRCGLEGRALCDSRWIDERAGGAMLLAGPVDPSQRASTLAAQRHGAVQSSSEPTRQTALRLETADLPVRGSPTRRHSPYATRAPAQVGRNTYPCPIPGCSKVFTNTRGGWDAHVASRRLHRDWHPDITDPKERKRLFRNEYGTWFQ